MKKRISITIILTLLLLVFCLFVINIDIEESEKYDFINLTCEQPVVETIIEEHHYNYTNFIIQKDIIYPRRQIVCEQQAMQIEITGNSMMPFLWSGDKLWVQPIKWDHIELGDVIVYNKVMHAVINKYKDELYTQGYSNYAIDKPINKTTHIMIHCDKVII